MSFFGDHKTPEKKSMTRVLAFMLGISCALAISPTMGWPLAFVCVAVLFCLPFTKLFESKDGASLFGKFIDKFGIGGFGTGKSGAAQIVEAFTAHEWKDGDPDAGIL